MKKAKNVKRLDGAFSSYLGKVQNSEISVIPEKHVGSDSPIDSICVGHMCSEKFDVSSTKEDDILTKILTK